MVKQVYAVIIDGAASGAIIRACDDYGVKYLAAKNFSAIEDAKVVLISL